jgi:hypothetical protein
MAIGESEDRILMFTWQRKDRFDEAPYRRIIGCLHQGQLLIDPGAVQWIGPQEVSGIDAEIASDLRGGTQ